MNTLVSTPAPHSTGRAHRLAGVPRELLARQRTLTVFAAVLLVLLLPATLAWGLDERLLRGVNVWVKPMKFAVSIAVLALTTAWFIGHLSPAQRHSRGVRWVVALIVGAGSFELAYIALQAGLGEGSHYNVAGTFHAVMYPLMGLGALLLTASQPLLAWQLYRHPDPALPPAYRASVLLGLGLTFLLGAGIGGLLSAVQPPDGSGLPLVGWSLAGGDLRPAHFFGVHAQQLLPLAGLALARWVPRQGRRAAMLLAALYTLGCIGLVVQALDGVALAGY
ncbi:hypothetical protein M8A51_05335 [Schlegelella sp. S2-27]|uniref:Uncharacterized protein n=1 Tax=Caldimonas mangrovi TaxID=2944811 RepID=A0ABT0YJP3_9BURK|nr:hypothetical protein [Caldimonas mangrovi]MCM5678951.1 hypothetical protein [Caldimonas mangrovi]